MKEAKKPAQVPGKEVQEDVPESILDDSVDAQEQDQDGSEHQEGKLVMALSEEEYNQYSNDFSSCGEDRMKDF